VSNDASSTSVCKEEVAETVIKHVIVFSVLISLFLIFRVYASDISDAGRYNVEIYTFGGSAADTSVQQGTFPGFTLHVDGLTLGDRVTVEAFDSYNLANVSRSLISLGSYVDQVIYFNTKFTSRKVKFTIYVNDKQIFTCSKLIVAGSGSDDGRSTAVLHVSGNIVRSEEQQNTGDGEILMDISVEGIETTAIGDVKFKVSGTGISAAETVAPISGSNNAKGSLSTKVSSKKDSLVNLLVSWGQRGYKLESAVNLSEVIVELEPEPLDDASDTGMNSNAGVIAVISLSILFGILLRKKYLLRQV
jgi:hypothetical protein